MFSVNPRALLEEDDALQFHHAATLDPRLLTLNHHSDPVLPSSARLEPCQTQVEPIQSKLFPDVINDSAAFSDIVDRGFQPFNECIAASSFDAHYSDACVQTTAGQDIGGKQPPEGEDDTSSTHSWTEEDDNEAYIYFRLEHKLRAFRDDARQQIMYTEPFSRSQRRVIHAMAHLLHLAHESEGSGDNKRLRISKRPADFPKGMQAYPGLGVALNALAGQSTVRIVSSATPHSSRPHSSYSLDQNSEQGYSSSASSVTSQSVKSLIDSSTWRRRRRQPKVRGGYPCTEADCQKNFDRACDLAHHSRIHQAKAELPYECKICSKRFMYPKDLRRHGETHEVVTSDRHRAVPLPPVPQFSELILEHDHENMVRD